MKKTILPITLSLLTFATPIFAEDKEEPARDPFAEADRNNDDKLSSSEFNSMMLDQFEAMDKDRSRDLTGEELGEKPSPTVVAMDTNKDAKITRSEFTAGVRELFATLDTDENRGVTKGELSVLTATEGSKGSGAKGSGTKKP